jgi:hypothetical protein
MIHILWCTLRTAQFQHAHAEWIKRAYNPENIQTYVAVNWEQHATELKDYLKNNFLITLNTNKIGVCYPSYQLSSNLGIKMGKCEDNDIVVFASDGQFPFLPERMVGGCHILVVSIAFYPDRVVLLSDTSQFQAV